MINRIKYSAKEIAQAVGGSLYGKNAYINGLSINSKEKSPSSHCFFAIKGEKFNGDDFVDEAISNGAEVIVTERKMVYPVSTIHVENTRMALGLLAKHHSAKKKVIGITGSYGKTCVKDMVISVLREKFSVCGTQENYNNEIGVPLTLLSTKNEKFCVVEMGMRAKGEIEWLSYISQPDLSVVTSCGLSHIETLGSKENIFEAKMEILKSTKSCCVLPSDRRFYEYECGGLRKILVGNKGEYSVKEVKREGDLISFKIGASAFSIKSTYLHNVDNALFAYAVGKYYGLLDEEIKEGLQKWIQRENRGGELIYRGIKIINDCYNASYESVKSAISSLSHLKNKNIQVAVLLGDMLELGVHAEQLHYNVGLFCKQKGIDRLYVIGNYAKNIILGYGEGEELANKQEIEEKVINELKEGDILLVKASHAMGFEKIIENMREK